MSATRMSAPRLTLLLGLVLAVGVLLQGLFAGGFLGGGQVWRAWHEVLGDALVLPPLVGLLVALLLLRRHPEAASVLATRVVLLAVVVVVIVTGHAGRSLLVVHIPAAIAVVGMAVRQATGFVRVPSMALRRRRDQDVHPSGRPGGGESRVVGR